MIALLSLVVLSSSSKPPIRPPRIEARPAVFGERLVSALGDAWRVLIG